MCVSKYYTANKYQGLALNTRCVLKSKMHSVEDDRTQNIINFNVLLQFINYLSFQQAVGANGFDNIDQPTISPNTKYWDFSTRERGRQSDRKIYVQRIFLWIEFHGTTSITTATSSRPPNEYIYLWLGWAGTTVNRIGRTRQHITTNAVTEMEECTIELICVYLISNACLHADYYHYFA